MSQNLAHSLEVKQVVSDHLGQEPNVLNGLTEEKYVSISESSEFKALVKKKNSFIGSISILFLGLYILLPILTSFTTILDGKAFGDITWVWIYSLGLFIMTWVLCMLYVKKANVFDQDSEKIIEKAKDGGY